MGSYPKININLHSDITISGNSYFCIPFVPLCIKGVGAQRVVTISNGPLYFSWGNIALENLAFACGAYGVWNNGVDYPVKLHVKNCKFAGSGILLRCLWPLSSIFLEGANIIQGSGNGTGLEVGHGALVDCSWPTDTTLTFNGSFGTTVMVNNGGIANINCSIDGNATGTRYYAYQGGSIFTGNKGVNAIPGDKVGGVDDTSVYA